MRSNPLKAIDVNLFKVFVAIYGQRNLTRAGESLAMTQPSVSRALDRLRAVFNDRLFNRMDGEMQPTRTAQLLAPHIFEGLARLEDSLALHFDTTPKLQAVNLRLGVNDYLSTVMLPQVVARLREHWPLAFLSTVPSTYETASEQVLREEIDCAIVSSLTDSDRIASRRLFEEDYVAMMARDHPLAMLERLDLDAYLSVPHLLVSYTGINAGWVDQKLATLGVHRTLGVTVHLYAGLPQLLLSHPYICTIPRKLAERMAAVYALSTHELPFESACHTFHLIWARHQTRNRVSVDLREEIAMACAALDVQKFQ